MNYFFYIVWLCWLLSEILLNRLVRSKQPESKSQDKGSLGLIWLAITVSMTGGIVCAIYLHAPFIHSLILSYLGSAFILTGMLIRFIAIRTLGRYFTVNLALHGREHQLVKSGMYKFIRHPSYTGSLLSFLGFGLSLNNWISLLIIVIPVLITFLNRISIEEKMMAEQFGSEYSEYQKRTRRLIPLIY